MILAEISPFFSDPFFLLTIGIIVVVGGIIFLKLNPFLALLIAAFAVAILTPGSSIIQFAMNKGATQLAAEALANKSVGERIATEFGNTCAKIGILIAMAAIIGKSMLESGAAERIVRSMLNTLGLEKAPVAFLVSSFFLGIPVFFDIVIFLMIPLAKAVTMRTGKNYLLLILAITGGAAMANSFVPPAPGPLFLIGEMNIPIGMMMAGGTLLGLFTITAGYFFAVWADKKWPVQLRDSLDARLEDIKKLMDKPDSELPPLWMALLPVIFPLFMICADNIVDNAMGKEAIVQLTGLKKVLVGFIEVFGDKNIALITGGILALLVLLYQKRNNKNLSSFVQTALMSGGGIILITAAGGAFGGMLQQTGISYKIGELTKDYQMALIPMAFLISAIVRTAQGSATVALITASGILSGLATSANLEFHPIYLGLAIGCGSKLVPWMNDAGFWIIIKISNLTEKEALKTFSPMLVVMGTVGLIVLMIAAKLFPMV